MVVKLKYFSINAFFDSNVAAWTRKCAKIEELVSI